MKSMALLPTTALVALLAAASSGQAQNPPRSDPKSAPTEKSESTSEAIRRAGDAAKAAIGMNNSITGCLKQGDESDPYVLMDSDTGKSVTVVGLGELAEHINHTVRLEGSWKAAGDVYQATGIELVALSCEEAPSSAGHEGGSGWRRAADGITADQQGQSPADRKTTQDIRRAVVADKSLSTYARNVKIITRDGVVTLKGAVRSERERASIESLARAAASQVHNELIVVPGDPNPGPDGERQP